MLLTERRLPGLHLPEAVSKIDMPKFDVPNLEAPQIELPEFEMPHVDPRKSIAAAIAAVERRVRPKPSRRPWAVAGLLIVTATAAWVVITNTSIRQRLFKAVDDVRRRMEPLLSGLASPSDPVAFPAAETAPMQQDPYADLSVPDANDYPPGLGSNGSDAERPKVTMS